MKSRVWHVIGSLKKCLSGAADMAMPTVCAGCGAADAEDNGLCPACSVRLLELVSMPACPRCGSTMGPNIPVREGGCWQCPQTLPRFSRVFRLGPYTDPLRSVVRELKYRRTDSTRRRVGSLLAHAVAAGQGDRPFELVVPVPMYWLRRLARGCDHAGMLASTVAKELCLPLGHELIRVRNTPPQVHLARTARLQNVRGAFKARSPVVVAGARVLLVDDVTTTGATASEAARTLLDAGAYEVALAVVAKSESPRAYSQHLE